jgi:Rubredoxin-like zinc ribbon domain (DUF35_N)
MNCGRFAEWAGYPCRVEIGFANTTGYAGVHSGREHSPSRKVKMARKKAKRKGPKRACESCGALYHPRAKACPKCGAANPVFEGTRWKRGGKAGDASPLEAAVEFVEQAGSIKAARAAMDRIEQIRGL